MLNEHLHQLTNGNNAADAHDYEQYWEIVEEFPKQSNDDLSGYWVAVSDDGSRILYSAPNYQPDDDPAGDIGNADKPDDNDVEAATTTMAASAGPDNDDWYNPATGAVLLWHNGEQEAFLRGGCAREGFGQTVSMLSGVDAATMSTNSAAPPVVVNTRAGCWTIETFRTVTVWEAHNNGTVTNLPVRDLSKDCVMGGTGTAAKVSKDGKRIVILAACLDQRTYQTKKVIYTFEKDPNSQAWVELVSDNDDVVVIDSDLPQYRMSSFAFDDDAKTLILTAGGGGFSDQGKDLLCYKWNETVVSWQESWRKIESDDFGIAAAVALSGNGKRLAIIGTSRSTFRQNLVVYDLP